MGPHADVALLAQRLPRPAQHGVIAVLARLVCGEGREAGLGERTLGSFEEPRDRAGWGEKAERRRLFSQCGRGEGGFFIRMQTYLQSACRLIGWNV